MNEQKDRCILFDFDGTLVNTAEGICKAVNHMLKAWGIEERPEDELTCFIGPPLQDSLREVLGFTDEECQKGIALFQEYYVSKGIYEAEVYPDIPEMLASLRQQGYTLGIATSKPEEMARKAIDHFDLTSCFDFIAGSQGGEGMKKADVIEFALQTNGIEDRDHVFMVGDRQVDILGATTEGVHGIGVLYGFGTREELEEAGAEYIAETPQDVLKYFTKN